MLWTNISSASCNVNLLRLFERRYLLQGARDLDSGSGLWASGLGLGFRVHLWASGLGLGFRVHLWGFGKPGIPWHSSPSSHLGSDRQGIMDSRGRSVAGALHGMRRVTCPSLHATISLARGRAFCNHLACTLSKQ